MGDGRLAAPYSTPSSLIGGTSHSAQTQISCDSRLCLQGACQVSRMLFRASFSHTKIRFVIKPTLLIQTEGKDLLPFSYLSSFSHSMKNY